jgi:manganese transport system substrate-binding protein
MSWNKAFKAPFVITSVITGLILMSFGACSQLNNNIPTNDSTNPQAEAQGKKNKKLILTTFTVLADMAQNVAGDKAVVESLIKSGAEIHGYEPTPSDLVRGKQADLILDNGLGLERWAARYYTNLSKVPHITLSEGIKSVAISGDAYQGKPNPHAWMSPQNALIYVDNIRKALVKIDPVNAESYHRNASIYSQKIRDIDKKLKQEVAVVPPAKRYMVSCEGAFTYLTRDYGLKEVYLWPVNSEQQATPQRTKNVIDTVKANQIPVVFCESTVNAEVQKQVAKEANAKFGGVFYVDSLSPPTGPASTYLKLLDYNVTTLIQGLQSQP